MKENKCILIGRLIFKTTLKQLSCCWDACPWSFTIYFLLLIVEEVDIFLGAGRGRSFNRSKAPNDRWDHDMFKPATSGPRYMLLKILHCLIGVEWNCPNLGSKVLYEKLLSCCMCMW